MKKSEKKKETKVNRLVEMHQHKTFKSGSINVHGFSHPLNLKHEMKKTQKAHDDTIRIDNGEKPGEKVHGKRRF